MSSVKRYLTCLIHGALLGGFAGVLCGGLEYLVLFRERAFSVDVTRAYWNITVAHALVGLVGGTLIGVGVCVVLRRRTASQCVAWLYTLFIPLSASWSAESSSDWAAPGRSGWTSGSSPPPTGI